MDFAKFIKKLGKIRKKTINLLLDTPSDYEYDYPYCIGWKDNPKYKEEVENYKDRLMEYEEQKKILTGKRNKLWEKPEAGTYLYVKEEYDAAKCPTCIGTGIIPAVKKRPGFTCYKCRGTGTNEYLPKVTAKQRQVANKFKKELESLGDPEFSSFPRRKKSIFIRVVHGGQVFIVEK